MMLALILSWLASSLPGIGKIFVDGYKVKVDAQNTHERIAADLASKEFALEARERELQARMVETEPGPWWASIRRLFAMPFIIFVWKVLVFDKVFQSWTHGSTDPLSPEMMKWGGVILIAYFGGRSLEKGASIVAGAFRKS